MVEITAVYEGQLHCTAAHGPSRTTLATDAPKDNMGRGESFSPTDLMATALGTCILTTMAIVGNRQNIDIAGATVRVEKHMTTSGPRRIARLPVEVRMPRALSPEDQQRLEHAAHACPVHKSLHPDIEAPISFTWG
jgi:putative redox protein